MIKNNYNFYKESKILNVITKLLYKKTGSKCNFFYISSPGSSPSKVYMFKDNNNNMYAAKICKENLSRVPLYNEAENLKKIYPFLKQHLPKIIYIGRYKKMEIMISQCFGIDNFYSSFISNKKPITFYYDIWNKVLIELMQMWKKSMNYNYNPDNNPRNNKLRIQRIEKSVLSVRYNGYSFDSIKKLTMVINGKEYISLDKAIIEIKKISNPKFGITCHGDPQPSNIIISDDSSNWYLVDWEWSGHNHDFRLMFSHLYGWWATRLINITEYPEFTVRDNKIIINYKINYSEVIGEFQNMSKNMLIKNFNISQEDIDNINRFLALLYLGDLRFLNIWGRIDYLPILIGEAIKTICFVKKIVSKVNHNFTFEME